MTARFERHLEELYACRACPNVRGLPVTGAVSGTRVMLVGQAPGVHEADRARPFAHTAGRRLFGWFSEGLGISEGVFRRAVHIAAVIRCFPGRDPKSGGDRVPDRDEIERCGAHLDRELEMLRPRLVIAVGSLASRELAGISRLEAAVGLKHRGERAGVVFDVVVLPHPSGRSTWMNRPGSRAFLERSLRLIGDHEAFAHAIARAK